MHKCTFGVAENSGIQKLNSSDCQPILLSYIMGYGKHKTHTKMSDPNTPSLSTRNPRHEKSLWVGDVPFKKGPDHDRLLKLMVAHGLGVHEMTAIDVIREDEYFDQFKLNSLKACVTAIKKELAQHERVELGLDGKSCYQI
jgi:hypothetical protein